MTGAGISPVALAFREEWPRLVATLVRQLGDLDVAEDVAQEAFVEASRVWRSSGIPDRPGAWLLTTARRKAIDRVRRDQRFDARLPLLAAESERPPTPQVLVDDQLALLFGCCHPALDIEAQVALTLRAVGGLTTGQIARSFLVPEPTMAKRLVRAKKKIKAAAIPFSLPDRDRLDERLEAVCAVIYAIFTEGHASSQGTTLLRGTLCDEAIWLAETLSQLAPDEPEVRGLAALCLITDARRGARTDAQGRPVLLAEQDRSRWDRDKIDRGVRHLEASRGSAGPYRLQAIIAAVHAEATSYEETQWSTIISAYDLLVAGGGGPVVELNRAVAVAERDGPAAALPLLTELESRGELDAYHYLHSARAELLRRTGDHSAAMVAYERALERCDNESEREWLLRRIASLEI